MTRCPQCQRRLGPKGTCDVHGRPDAAALTPPPVPPSNVAAPPGWTLGRQIAVGGTSFVYMLEHATHPPAVLKWGRSRELDVRARFAYEAEVLRALGPPTTPFVIQHAVVDGTPTLVLEHVAGETLAAWMSRSGDRGGPVEIMALLSRLATALAAIHRAGFIHRDLKPENVVLATEHARILDLGLAKSRVEPAAGITEAGMVVGTTHYLAPEQLLPGGVMDHRGDLYAFGVIAFEMLAGRPPFTGEREAIEYQHKVSRPPALDELRPLPKDLLDLVAACLAKQPEARPASADQIVEILQSTAAWISTVRGVGRPSHKGLDAREPVVLVWIEGGDPPEVVRAITAAQGAVVRARGDAILAAFAAPMCEAPMTMALDACRELAAERCRLVVHHTSALLRRSAHGKLTFYGPDLEEVASWIPAVPFSGTVITAAAARRAKDTTVATDEPSGFFRERDRHRTDMTDLRREAPLVGRDSLIADVVAAATQRGVLIGISGDAGAGKTRVLREIVARARSAGRDVISIRGRRRFFGDRPDDDRLIEALGGGTDVAHALADARARGALLVVDDAHWLSREVRHMLVHASPGLARVVASPQPLVEVPPGATDRLAIELPPLSYSAATELLRALLHPARLIPDVLLERLAIRGCGNPGLLVALSRDITRRGGVRRHPGGDDWYVAADQVDTLLAAPSAAWLAVRAIEDLPSELVPVILACAALGPRFRADEVEAVLDAPDPSALLTWLVRDGELTERNGTYEFADASLQDAIYAHAHDERGRIHGRALRYWLQHRTPNLVGWLARVAHHAAGAGESTTAATSWAALAQDARTRGEAGVAAELEARALQTLLALAPPPIADAIRALRSE